MKLFKSLLVAPASLGLLAPMAATANEVTINDFNAAEEIAVTNSRVDGLEARLNNFEAGSFSETTTASFSVDTVIGAIDGASSETTSLDFQFNIGLSTSFTGEDSLDIAIDNGSGSQSVLGGTMGFDKGTSLVVDGVTYTFPVGGATMIVGDSTDLSALFTGACTYSSFTDLTPDDCGTGNSMGAGGKGVTAALGYAFDSGFSMAGGVTSGSTEILGDAADAFGLNAAYSTDSYGSRGLGDVYKRQPRTVSTLNDAVVVSEKLPASKLFNLASKPSTRLLVTAISSAALKSLIVTSFAVAAIGAKRPNDAGATSKLLKSFINFLTRNLKYTSR